jgi:hypothetical protein
MIKIVLLIFIILIILALIFLVDNKCSKKCNIVEQLKTCYATTDWKESPRMDEYCATNCNHDPPNCPTHSVNVQKIQRPLQQFQ